VDEAVASFLRHHEWPDRPAVQADCAARFRPELVAAVPRLKKLLHQAQIGQIDAIYASGLPTDQRSGALILLTLTGILGEPFNYSSQNEGKLVMELRPISGAGANTNATTGEFALHTDDAAMPRQARADFINLYGIVNAGGTLTCYSPVADALGDLSRTTIETLSEPRFQVRFPVSFGFGDNVWSHPCSVLNFGMSDDVELRFPSYAVRPVDEKDEIAKVAITELKQALEQHVVCVPVNPGCLLSFNNSRGAHKRGAVGGHDRLVLRTYAAQSLDLLRSTTGVPGPIFPLDRFIADL